MSGEPAKNPAAVALGLLGGSKGGHARAAKLTPARRSEIARRASRARWGTQDPEPAPTYAETLRWARGELAAARRQLALLRRKDAALVKMITGLDALLQEPEAVRSLLERSLHPAPDREPTA